MYNEEDRLHSPRFRIQLKSVYSTKKTNVLQNNEMITTVALPAISK